MIWLQKLYFVKSEGVQLAKYCQGLKTTQGSRTDPWATPVLMISDLLKKQILFVVCNLTNCHLILKNVNDIQ